MYTCRSQQFLPIKILFTNIELVLKSQSASAETKTQHNIGVHGKGIEQVVVDMGVVLFTGFFKPVNPM